MRRPNGSRAVGLSLALLCPFLSQYAGLKTQTRGQTKRIRCVCMFMCNTSLGSRLVKCQRPLPSVSPTGSFREVSPCPPWWHLQLLSFHPRVPDSGSNSCHLFSAEIIQIQQLDLRCWVQDKLCRDKKLHSCLRRQAGQKQGEGGKNQTSMCYTSGSAS